MSNCSPSVAHGIQQILLSNIGFLVIFRFTLKRIVSRCPSLFLRDRLIRLNLKYCLTTRVTKLYSSSRISEVHLSSEFVQGSIPLRQALESFDSLWLAANSSSRDAGSALSSEFALRARFANGRFCISSI